MMSGAGFHKSRCNFKSNEARCLHTNPADAVLYAAAAVYSVPGRAGKAGGNDRMLRR